MAEKVGKRRKRAMVVSRHGRYRFQSGMVTASLLKRGLEMADAFSISRALRDQLYRVEEISTDELEQRLTGLVKEHLGIDLDAEPESQVATESRSTPLVRSDDGVYPFSRGILIRQLVTAGIDLDPAMELARDIRNWLRELEEDEVGVHRVENMVDRRLLQRHGSPFARRYRFTNFLKQAKTPVIILLGGATGTGKSSLATQLAYRLGIRSVTSTDMIRETMRTVLPSEIVPGLHDHSFRGMLQGGQVLSNPRERVLAGYQQQVAQVAVGIRAVIRRTIRENTHMIIEGTHLRPPWHQYLPPNSGAVIAGFILAVPEEKRHRARFPKRARNQSLRDPNPYLDAFQSVRWIHDELLSDAEDVSALVVTNDDIDETTRSVVDYLSRVVPFEDNIEAQPVETSSNGEPLELPKTLFLILDGLSDEPNPALDGLTPLAAADTPNLEMLAGTGGQGLVMTTDDAGVAPSTDQGLLALLGEPSPQKRIGRGLLEALGQGLPLAPGSVLFRGNMATLAGNGDLLDRRAGRIRAGAEDLLAELRDIPLRGGIRGSIFPGHEHRVVVMLKGPGLSASISDTDPGGEAVIQRPLTTEALDDSPEASRTAAALTELLAFAHKHLDAHPHNEVRQERGLFSANCIITRGSASVSDLPPRRHSPDGAALVSACPTALGVARAVGLQAASTPAMTGNLDTDLNAKFSAAAELLSERHFVAIHIKGTDIAAHDRRPLEKRDLISAVDLELGEFLTQNPGVTDGLRVVVSADHGTSSVTGNHMSDPVPVLVSTWNGPAEPASFDEESAEQGALGLIGPGELSELLWSKSRRVEKV